MAEPGAPSYPFRDLPEGTVTFLFSDIEGSTQLLYRLGDRFTAVVGEHHRILRAAIGQAGGHVVRTEGDSFFVAFPRATAAVAAAVAAQRELAAHPWPEGAPIRVRMGLHTGEAEVALDDYVGIAVHRAARIAHAGCGGQVLLSETTAALTGDELPAGVTLLDLGRHLLKDIRRPERIAQLRITGLPAEFPPLKTQGVLPPEGARLPRPVGACPYRGLAAFREADAPFYCGREVFVGLLEGAVRRQALTAVIVGSSGSGKSSALFAGLLPRLRAEGGWQFALLRPGSQPFYALAGALLPLLESSLRETDRLAETAKLAERLAKGEIHLAQVIERIHEKADLTPRPPRPPGEGEASAPSHAGRGMGGGSAVLLVVDQFEELYTLCSDAKTQTAFIDELLALAAAGKGRRLPLGVILLTLRADFMGQALAHRPFADALQDGSVLMGPMTRAELRTAIEKPAELQGAAFEAGLVERILDDVGEKPGNLPLLEFTLTLLWERQTDGWLTHVYYEAMGSVEGALAAYADQVYAELEPAEQERARHALVQLVRPGEGTEDTRRVTTRNELGEENWRLIQHLADRRLVVTGRDAVGHETAEVVHEALIGRWGRFRGWMDADRAFRAWQERLRGSLQQWQESGQDEGALLAGAPLAAAETWLAERAGDLSAAEVGYIQASGALQARRQRERQRRRQLTVLGLSAGLLLALVLAGLALLQRQDAVTQRQAADTQRQEADTQRQTALKQAAVLLAGQAESELAAGYGDRAVLLALAALENFPYTVQAEHALGQAVSYSRAVGQYTHHQSAVTSVAWSPDGARVATSSSSENRVDIWDPRTGQTITTIAMPKGITGNKLDMALHVQWTSDGTRLLTLTGDRYSLGSQAYDLLLWEAASGKLLASVEIANQAAPESGELGVTFVNYPTGMAAEIAPRSGRLATLGGDNTALIWDAAWQKPALVLRGHAKAVNSVDWSPDETKLATASLDGTAVIWDAQSGAALYTLKGHEGRVNLALWARDGAALATAGEDGAVRLWNAADGKLARSIETQAGPVSSLAWAPNGVRIVSGHKDGSLRIWEVGSGKLLETLRGHPGLVTDLKWSPTNDRLASADGSGDVRVWNAAPSTAWRLYPPQAARGGEWSVQGASWTSDSRYLAMAGGDVVGSTEPGSFAIWDVQENKLIMEQMEDKLNFMGMEAHFSPDDKAILYLGFPVFPDFSGLATAYIFDAQSGEIIRTFTPSGDTLVRSAAWSPDGSQIAMGMFYTGTLANQIIIWDYRSGKQVTRLVHSETEGMGINFVEWSPDGSKIAAASDDSTVRVWDAHTWEPLYTLHHEPPAMLVIAAWSPDSKRLLTGGGNDERGAKDTTARIWDSATGKELLVFGSHTKSVWPGDWSPDGKRIATFGNDGTVRMWDSSTGAELLTLSVPVLYSGFALWSPDGQHLAVVGLETLISVWRVWQSTEELVAYAKDCCVIRELTAAERKQFGLP